MTVLVVDDDPQFSSAMRRSLKGWVRTARTIGEGLSVAQSWLPSVVLLDVNFQDETRTGIDALESFWAASDRSQIVVVTSLYLDRDAKRALDLGAAAYLEKGDVAFLQKVVYAARSRVLSRFAPGSSRLH